MNISSQYLFRTPYLIKISRIWLYTFIAATIIGNAFKNILKFWLGLSISVSLITLLEFTEAQQINNIRDWIINILPSVENLYLSNMRSSYMAARLG